MKNKKAESKDFMIKLIIVLVLLVVFSSIYFYIKGYFIEGTIREIRIQNVKNHANAHIRGIDVSSELNFPIIREEIEKGEELEVSSRALVHDWSDLLKAEKELFPTESEKVVYCVPGHYLKFKAKDQKISAREYVEYQNEHTVNEIKTRHVMGDTNVKIAEYLTGHTTDKSIFEDEVKTLKEELKDHQDVTIINNIEFFKQTEELKEEYAINTEYDYMTVFVYMKKGYWAKWLSSVFGTGIGIATGTTLGIVLVPFTGGGSLIISAAIIGGAAVGGTAGGIIGYKTGSDRSADWDAGIFLLPNKAEVLKDLGCNVIPARGETE